MSDVLPDFDDGVPEADTAEPDDAGIDHEVVPDELPDDPVPGGVR